MDNSTRRQLLDRARSAGFPGSILDVYTAYDQGRDLIQEFVQQQQMPQMQVAQTPQEQEQGLRPAHQAGQVDQSMAFPNVQPGQSFNTVGMKVPINIDKIDNQGNLVESYKAVPPGIQNLPTGPYEGTVIESPAKMKTGGVNKHQTGDFKTPPANLPWLGTKGQVLTEEEQKIKAERELDTKFGKGPTAAKAKVINEKKEEEELQRMAEIYRSSPSNNLPSGAITPTMGPVEIALMAPVAGASALRAAPIIGSALNTSIAGVQGLTVGNALGAGFASDAIVNRLPQVPGQLSRGEYADAGVNLATGALDLYGAGMLRPISRMIRPTYKGSNPKEKLYETDFEEVKDADGYVSGTYVPDYADGTFRMYRSSNTKPFKDAANAFPLPDPPPHIDIIGGFGTSAPRNTFKKFTNKSGLTKEEALKRVADKDKDVISKMSETEFQNSVLKPNGEIVQYEQGSLMDEFSGKQSIVPMTPKAYTEEFNSKIDLLNDIISKKNKSGVQYKVKELTEDGRLIFETPEQTVPKQLTAKQKENIERFTKDPEEWAVNKGGLVKEEKGWVYTSPNVYTDEAFKTKEEAIQYIRDEINRLQTPKTIGGQSSWGVGITSGQWRGDVKDIANTDYFRSIPGLEMRNTTQSVFADSTPRKGSGAYEAINEYLKKIDLGRVKPGFNSQTEFSRGAWENFINSGRAVGFYGNPSTVYGTMKTILPPALVVGGAAVAKEKKQMGGSYETNQEVASYEWRTGRPEESRKRYIVGGLKNRVLYNKAKYKR